MRGRLILALVAIMLFVFPLLMACGPAAPTTITGPTSTPAGTTAPPEPAKPIELIFSHHNPEVTAPAKAAGIWAKKIEELTGGRVKITMYYGGALLKSDEVFKGVQGGMADIAYYPMNVEEGFTLNGFTQLPFVKWPSQTEATEIYVKMLAKFPELRNEWESAGLKLFGASMMPPSHIHTTKKKITKPADLKGVKIIASGIMAESALELGATPVDIGAGDMYTSLERGLVDGVWNHYPYPFVFGCMPLIPYHLDFGEGGIGMHPNMLIMNLKKFNSLPPDIQKILVDADRIFPKEFIPLDAGTIQAAAGAAKGMNHTFTYVTDEQYDE